MRKRQKARTRIRLLAAIVVSALFVAGCGNGGDDTVRIADKDKVYDITSAGAPVQPANPASPYAEQLVDCVYAPQLRLSQLCSLATLPLIGQDTDSVDVETIMDRVLVSHPWMAERFREVLTTLPLASLDPFRSVTAVVIASDQPRSYFLGTTLAIYLDDSRLWLSAAEHATHPNALPPFADGPFKYRLVERGRTSTGQVVIPPKPDAPRTIDDIRYALAARLYNLLGAAADIVPPTMAAGVARSLRPVEVFEMNSMNSRTLGTELQRQHPLRSVLLRDLASVPLSGDAANDLLTTEPETVAAEYAADGGFRMRDFSNPHLDSADLIELAALKYFLGVDVEIAFVRSKIHPDGGSEIVWGQRDRLADAKVGVRARFVAESAYSNGLDWPGLFDELATPQFLTPGTSWYEIVSTEECELDDHCVVVGEGDGGS